MRAISHLIVATLAAALALLGCHRDSANTSAERNMAGPKATESHDAAPPSISWFDGSVDAAFRTARAESKPVVLYWGAEWCPPCNVLKANVFSRQDFIEKTRLFVPVYLDGDLPGAQKWAETFKVSGYPTVLVLKANRTELARASGGMDLGRYAEVLDLVLADARPIKDILALLKNDTAQLSPADCKRLAYHGWIVDENTVDRQGRITIDLQRVAERCPAESRTERARLTAMAESAAMSAERESLKAGKAPSWRLAVLVRGVVNILADRDLTIAAGSAIRVDNAFFKLAQRIDAGEPDELRKQWIAYLDFKASSAHSPLDEQLHAIRQKLRLLKELYPEGAIPVPLAAEARRRAEEALASTHDAYARVGVVIQATGILRTLGEQERADSIIEGETQTAKAPYEYMIMMAYIEEERGHPDQAVVWFKQAYDASQGPATRFQWGVAYIEGLVRLRPEDEAGIRDTAVAVLSEVDGPDRLYRLTRERFESLDSTLRKWNASGIHDQAIATIRNHTNGICSRIPAGESAARDVCDGFLAPSDG